ncbi:hypothetical protein [Xanthocytophaga flava]|uniref:hypothetical protein n=1 Tax=Xanthocytophaga flava TaxID=3048013 RepID=UPI0028D900B2|nr:hypothetical protein [Xanthocytophaga flavus]
MAVSRWFAQVRIGLLGSVPVIVAAHTSRQQHLVYTVMRKGVHSLDGPVGANPRVRPDRHRPCLGFVNHHCEM